MNIRSLFFVASLAAGSIFAAASHAGVVTVASTDVPFSIPDNNATGITSTLTGAALTNLTDINLTLSIAHTCVPDLHIELRSPTGTQAVLVKAFSEGGILTGTGCPGNFTSTTFDDEAATNLLAGAAPYTGSFNVNFGSILNPFNQFDGQSAAGVWNLFVSDRAGDDVGRLVAWSLTFTGNDAAVPEPASLALVCLALMGVGAVRRRKA